MKMKILIKFLSLIVQGAKQFERIMKYLFSDWYVCHGKAKNG